MRTLFAAFALISVAIISCQSDNKKDKTVDSTIMSDQRIQYKVPDECFEYKNDKSTASIIIYGTGDNKVLGELKYNFDGKDKNNGEFYGYMVGDTIIVDYKFQSEGTWSKRQIAWVRLGDKLLEGYGDTYQVNNSEVKFKNYRKLIYGKSIIMQKTICK